MNILQTMKAKVIAGVIATVTITIVVIAIIFIMKGKDTYRIIQVLEVGGTATVTRDSDVIDVYEKMNLQSGDEIHVSADGFLRLIMDEDKFIYLEPATKILLEASGNKVDSKTKLHLMSGAVVNELKTKLSPNSSYEVSTPNSTMAVRGTVFRVAITYDEENNSYTTVQVMEGIVESTLINPDGSLDTKTEKRMIGPGKMVKIRGDKVKSVYLVDLEDIDWDEMPSEVIEVLCEIVNGGHELTITIDTLNEILGERKAKEEQEALSGSDKEQVESNKNEDEEDSNSLDADITPPITPTPTVTPTSVVTSTPKVTPTPVVTPTPIVTPTPTVSASSDSDNNSSSSSSSPSQYTVTFVYGRTTFATQTVTSGGTATEPKLMPAQSGSWNWNFSDPVTSDITIEWN